MQRFLRSLKVLRLELMSEMVLKPQTPFVQSQIRGLVPSFVLVYGGLDVYANSGIQRW